MEYFRLNDQVKQKEQDFGKPRGWSYLRGAKREGSRRQGKLLITRAVGEVI